MKIFLVHALGNGAGCFILCSRLPCLWEGMGGGFAEQLLCEWEVRNVVDKCHCSDGVTIWKS